MKKYLIESSKIAAPFGVLIYIYFVVVFQVGHNAFFSFWGNLVILIVAIGVFLTLYFFSRKQESFSFAQGLLLGLISIVVMGVVSCSAIYFSCEYWISGAVELYKSESLKHLTINKDALIEESSQEVYRTYLASIPLINSLNSTTRYFFSNIMIPGLMFSILSSLPLRKKKVEN